jgi:hypothetical protein
VKAVRALLTWTAARGLTLAAVRTDDLVAYQSELYTLRRVDGHPRERPQR